MRAACRDNVIAEGRREEEREGEKREGGVAEREPVTLYACVQHVEKAEAPPQVRLLHMIPPLPPLPPPKPKCRDRQAAGAS